MKTRDRGGIPYRNLNSLRTLAAVLAVAAGIGLAVLARLGYLESETLYEFVSFPSEITVIGDELYAVIPSGMAETTISVQEATRVTIDGVEYHDGDVIDCSQWDDESVELRIWRRANPFCYTGKLHFYCLDNLPTVNLTVQEDGIEYILSERDLTVHAVLTTADENGTEDAAGSGELKVHGNTTWGAAKSSYQIAMEEPTAVLGMDASQKWLLISNYADQSGVLNLYAYTLQQELDVPYAPQCREVNLYINGAYQGLYLLIQKINTGETPMVELCGEYTYLEAERGLTTTHRYMRLRYPVYTDDEDEAEIADLLETAEQALYDEDSDAFTEYYDLTSWSQQYLLQELMVNGDTELNSEYFRIEDGMLYAGPGWDYDRSFSAVMGDFDIDTQSLHVQGLKDDYMASDRESYAKLWLPQLYEHQEFRDALEDYYTHTFSTTAHAVSYQLTDMLESLNKSQMMDARLWHDEDTVNNAIDRMQRWLVARLAFLDSYIGHEDAFEQEITVMDEGRFDVIYCYPK